MTRWLDQRDIDGFRGAFAIGAGFTAWSFVLVPWVVGIVKLVTIIAGWVA